MNTYKNQGVGQADYYYVRQRIGAARIWPVVQDIPK